MRVSLRPRCVRHWLLVIEHRAEIAHVEPTFMRTEIEPCQSDGHGELGYLGGGGDLVMSWRWRASAPMGMRVKSPARCRRCACLGVVHPDLKHGKAALQVLGTLSGTLPGLELGLCMAVHDERVAAGRQFTSRSVHWRWCCGATVTSFHKCCAEPKSTAYRWASLSD